MRKVQRNAVAVAAITIVFAGLTNFVRPAALLGRVAENFDAIPRILDGWKGRDVDARRYAVMVPNSSLLVRDYVNEGGRWANLTVVYGLDATDMHNPEYCFESQGWREVRSRTVTVRQHPAKMLLLDDAKGGAVLSVYWYAGPNGSTDSLAAQRSAIWKQALLSHRVRPSAVVRILVPVVEGQSTAEHDALSLADLLDPCLRWMFGDRGKALETAD